MCLLGRINITFYRIKLSLKLLRDSVVISNRCLSIVHGKVGFFTVVVYLYEISDIGPFIILGSLGYIYPVFVDLALFAQLIYAFKGTVKIYMHRHAVRAVIVLVYDRPAQSEGYVVFQQIILGSKQYPAFALRFVI